MFVTGRRGIAEVPCQWGLGSALFRVSSPGVRSCLAGSLRQKRGIFQHCKSTETVFVLVTPTRLEP